MIVPYALRIAMALAKSLPQAPLHFLEEARLPMRLWPTDVDFYGHANNGSYLVLMDVGRYQLAQRTGLAKVMLRDGCWPVLGGTIVRFRREIRMLERFELCSRFIGWDGKWFFVEQRFEKDGTVHASAIHKAVMRRKGKSVPFQEIAHALGVTGPSPEIPDLEKWQSVLSSRGDAQRT